MPDVNQPKYWDEEAREVEEGVEWDTDPIPITTLPGTYHWVWEHSIYAIEEKDGAEDGQLILSFPRDAKPTPENLCGELHIFDLSGKFKGVKTGDTPNKNCWLIDNLEWDTEEMAEEAGGGNEHAVVIYKPADDNGNRIISFIWDQGYVGCAPTEAILYAKKQTTPGDIARLTESEKDRLGMGLKSKTVAERALKAAGDDKIKQEEGKVKVAKGEPKVAKKEPKAIKKEEKAEKKPDVVKNEKRKREAESDVDQSIAHKLSKTSG